MYLRVQLCYCFISFSLRLTLSHHSSSGSDKELVHTNREDTLNFDLNPFTHARKKSIETLGVSFKCSDFLKIRSKNPCTYTLNYLLFFLILITMDITFNDNYYLLVRYTHDDDASCPLHLLVPVSTLHCRSVLTGVLRLPSSS